MYLSSKVYITQLFIFKKYNLIIEAYPITN